MAVVGLVTVALVVGLVAFGSTRESSHRSQSFCWGTLSAKDLRALFPPSEFKGNNGDMGYPATDADGCRLISEFHGMPSFEYKLDRKYSYVDQFDGVRREQVITTALGNGLLGTASDFSGWVRVPPCRAGDADWYAEMIARDLRPTAFRHPVPNMVPAKSGNRRLLAQTLVRMTNAVRGKAGCTEPGLPAPAIRDDPAVNALVPGKLCGTTSPGVDVGVHPSWTEQWSGTDDSWEDCLVVDGARPGDEPLIRVSVRRGPLADLSLRDTPNTYVEGRIRVQGGVATYPAVCSRTSVHYELAGNTFGRELPPAEDLLRALIAGNVGRDGCTVATI
ncbi:hypothetical protein [Streptomyces sp. SID3343]|uniref:hypothetical protein n=1 Tax=Streptomyces sp. SID3343 TaxID=2690260 RepID=UPI00136C73F4|nr:hypothetical protein [Streptomyces sp. SID3343]MYW00901.1 hypothetical protein [Streptomyces sp. SID3343]